MKITYSANNSGGHWWLKDADWKKLEAAGWAVQWGGEYFCHSKFSFGKAPEGKPQPCEDRDKCPGHQRYDSADEVPTNDRWLGCLAKEASKDFATAADAIRDFERVTGQDASDEGCNCCGAPHSFNWHDENDQYQYASGDGVVAVLHGADAPTSLREAVELLKSKR